MILGAEEVTLRRFEATRGSDGRTAMTLVKERSIRASVQPLTDRQRQALPEGVRTSVEKRIYTREEVRTADQHTATPADVVVINGEEYIAVQVKEWRQLLAHFEVDLMRKQEIDDA